MKKSVFASLLLAAAMTFDGSGLAHAAWQIAMTDDPSRLS
jgi:hypothetical protein